MQVSSPAAERIGSATVSEHWPTQEMSWILRILGSFRVRFLLLEENHLASAEALSVPSSSVEVPEASPERERIAQV